MALALAVLGMTLLSLLWLMRQGFPFLPVALPGQEVVVWGRFERLSGDTLSITLEEVPPGFVGSTLPKKMVGSSLALKVNPAAPFLAKYYRGGLIGGVEILSEPMNMDRLYPNMFLRITARREGWNGWTALEIIRPQVVELPPPPESGQVNAPTKYPLISPP